MEEDPEIEALSTQPLATPTSSAHSKVARHKNRDHTHIDLEQGHDIPGLVTSPEVGYPHRSSNLIMGHPIPLWNWLMSGVQVEYKGGVKGGASVVSVVLEEAGREVEGGERNPLQESVSQSSETSTSSDTSTRGLLTKY